MGYFLLTLTILFESASIIFMKLSSGFQNKGWSALAILAYILTFFFLTHALKYLGAGVANAVWAGTSTVLVALLGVIIFKEQLSFYHYIFLSLIIIGIVGLSITKTV